MAVSVEVTTADPGDDAQWLTVLDADERARWSRFVHREDQRAFAAAHGLLRRALSLKDPTVAPAAWRFSRGEHGKPYVEGLRWSFNLSHCRELVAVAISEREVGVDVETIDARHATDDVARRVFGPRELEDLATHADRTARFFERWVLKEAWVKATGVGIDDELPAFELRIDEGRAFSESDWHFHWWTPKPNVKLALCSKTTTISLSPWGEGRGEGSTS